MIRDRLKGLARRVRRGAEPSVETGFGPDQDAVFARVHDDLEGHAQSIGAAVVSSWEVLLTDLGRALRGRLEEEQRGRLVERASDGLVPTQAAVQALGRKLPHDLKQAVQQALSQGELATALVPIRRQSMALGASVAEGWQKTADYLEPVYEAVADEGTVCRDFTAQGAALKHALEQAAGELGAALDGLPGDAGLESSIRDALDAWKASCVRAVETLIYDGRTTLVDAAEALPELG